MPSLPVPILHKRNNAAVFNPERMNFSSVNKNELETTMIWACSPVRRRLLGKRERLADRKLALEHLRPRQLIFSTIRVAIVQGGQVMTTFLTDQLEYESANEELVVQGKISPDIADKMNEEWEKIEWDKRWKEIPKRFLHAFLKLQSAIVFMRIYEQIAAKLCSPKTLDKLTKDTFKSAKRKAGKYEFAVNKNFLLGKKMFHTCLWSNAISFLSDYTVQQCILLAGHCIYYRHQRQIVRERIREKVAKENQDKDDEGEEVHRQDVGAGGIGLSFALKSSNLLISRGTSWIISSGSGAIGSVIYPGWGTLFGTQLGDGIVGALMDG